MPPPAAGVAVPTIAVIGNPNAGKSTLFNRLTGLRQKVANYPGVTVEKKEGYFSSGERRVRLLDLPGTYSLAAHSLDEIVAVDVLLGQQKGETRPDLILQVVDASNLERNLYLFSQLVELGTPIVVALNMTDIAERRGLHTDPVRLAEELGVPVVATRGDRGGGVDGLRELLLAASAAPAAFATPKKRPRLDDALESAIESLQARWSSRAHEFLSRELHRFELLRALVDDDGSAELRLEGALGPEFRDDLRCAREHLSRAGPLPALEARSRYAWIRELTSEAAGANAPSAVDASERLDRLLTHRVFGIVVFLAVMTIVFQSIFTWAEPLMSLVEEAFQALGTWIGSALPEGAFSSLVVDGVIAGVGNVVVFLPQILILFLFIGFLEDCGYMARAAFIMDRLMAKCGLSGKSFIPMLSGFACAVPAIMATRVIENRRDRIATILVTPLMSCSARLPVYAILIETFIPDRSLFGVDVPVLGEFLGLQAATLLALYVLGIVVAIAMASIFKRTILRGKTPPFVLELPSYKLPALSMVLLRLYDRGKEFLLRAGTIIFAISVIVWALLYFPHPAEVAAPFAERRTQIESELQDLDRAAPGSREEGGAAAADEKARLEDELSHLAREEAGAYQRQSWLGRSGHWVAPLFAPLGWDWKISMAAIASFPAREVVVSTLGTIYNLGADEDESSPLLRDRLRAETWPETDRKVFTVPVALSILVFFALCCQCGATIATIRRETGSWRWAWFTFGYMTALAYVGAFFTYQIASRI